MQSDLQVDMTRRKRPGLTVGRALESVDAHLKGRRWHEAEQLLNQLSRRAPRHRGVWHRLYLLARQTNRMPLARTYLARVAALDPSDAKIQSTLGGVCRALGDRAAAAQHYQNAIKLDPDNPLYHAYLGNVFRELKRAAEAATSFRRAVALHPRSVQLKINLAYCLADVHRGEEAVEFIRQAIELAPEEAERRVDLGNIFLTMSRYEDALVAYQEAVAVKPDLAGAYHNIGTVLQQLGRLDEAAEAYKKTLALRPDSIGTRRQLAGIRRSETRSDEVNELESLLDSPALPDGDRAELHLALAKSYDDLSQFDRAFEHLQAGNQILRNKLRFDPDKNSQYVDQLINTFTPAFFRERETFGVHSDLPVFIVGMPRSGTTLVEQIICSHPSVHGAGELKTIHEIVNSVRARLQSRDENVVSLMPRLDAALVKDMANDYLSSITALNPAAQRITDKMPFNFRHLGAIALMFPQARIIHCQRHPLDVCLSCYFVKFNESMDFTYNLVDLGNYYREYVRLMEHWKKTLRVNWLHVSYGDLVARQEEVSRELIEFCGLDWDDACLQFHATERPVLTASNWQVRQPIYSSSVERWRNYERFLEPLKSSLGDLLTDEAINGAATSVHPDSAPFAAAH